MLLIRSFRSKLSIFEKVFLAGSRVRKQTVLSVPFPFCSAAILKRGYASLSVPKRFKKSIPVPFLFRNATHLTFRFRSVTFRDCRKSVPFSFRNRKMSRNTICGLVQKNSFPNPCWKIIWFASKIFITDSRIMDECFRFSSAFPLKESVANFRAPHKYWTTFSTLRKIQNKKGILRKVRNPKTRVIAFFP